MKYALLGAIILSCNQQMYDSIYETIIQNLLDKPVLTEQLIKEKNDTIETLRKLCNGQKSSYERN